MSRGLRALVAEDDNVEIVADEVPHEQLERVIAREAPDVAEAILRILRDEGVVVLLSAETLRVQGRSGEGVSGTCMGRQHGLGSCAGHARCCHRLPLGAC